MSVEIDSVAEINGWLRTLWARATGAAPQFDHEPPPETDPPVSSLEETDAGRDEPPAWNGWQGPLDAIPKTRPEVYRVFGNPGKGSPNREFQYKNLVVAENLPGSWNKGRGRLYMHRLAEPYLREALRRAELNGSLPEIHRLGCYSFRHQRHDPTRPLSYHSWGIAIDINPRQNRVRRFRRGQKPPYWGDEWKRHWPEGISERLVEAFESVGWRWGGRWRTFVDGMHFELVA